MNARLYIATTKEHIFPADDNYVPLMVGRAAPSGWRGLSDDVGDNISRKNPFYCELTGQYWIWKNDDTSDVKGLCHYRRYLWLNEPPARIVKRSFGSLNDCAELITTDGLLDLLTQYDCLLPRAYAFSSDTIRSQFVNWHGEENLRIMYRAVKKISPEYLPTMERIFERRYVHFANIIIARREVFDEYSAWLFAVLFEAERQVDLANPANARLFGYLSERLLNVYVAHKNLKFKELPEIFIAGEGSGKFIDDQRVDFRYFKRRYCPSLLKWEEKLRRMVKKPRDGQKS